MRGPDDGRVALAPGDPVGIVDACGGGNLADTAERVRAALADRYPIERELGRGGMATVYLSQDLKHHRPVAVKVLHPELVAVLGADRFLREIEFAAQFTHPHILPLYDSGDAAGFLYYVMPFVEGESLRNRLDRERQLPLDDALRITREVADALAYAHHRGVVHRDIKPENILLTREHAIVADFGIARAINAAGGEKLTGTGFSVGTPTYMSPEQAAAEPVDGRSDLFSLGCVLYEALAGEPPFTGATAQVIAARRAAETPRPLRAIRDAVPEAVDAAVRRVLSRVPADRYATATEFAAALGGGGETASTPPVAAGRRRRLPLLVGAALTLAAAATVWRIGQPDRTPLNADLLAVAPFQVLDPALALWREGLVDQLSKNLDGAGSLRTVAPSTYLRGEPARVDRETAEALGARTGAGLVVYGDLIAEGRDSVRLRAVLLDAMRDGPPAEVVVAGPASRLGALADSLSVRLIRVLGEHRPSLAPRQVLLGARPLPALKSYLQGEQAYRRLQYDDALAHFSRAIAADSNFALAYRRMALALGFHPTTAGEYPALEVCVQRASQLNHGLSARDSLLIVGDSLAYTESSDAIAQWDRLRAIREETVRLYPGDPEAWLGLGEFLSHSGWPFYSPAQALDAFEHAIALDSALAPAYEHVMEEAVSAGKPDRGVLLVRAYIRHIPPELRSEATGPLALIASLLDSSGYPARGLGAADSTTATILFRVAFEGFGNWPDSGETAVRLTRRLLSGGLDMRGAPPWVSDSASRWNLLSAQLTRRGHLAEAYAAFPTLPPIGVDAGFNEYAALALLGAVPAESAAATFERELSGKSVQGVARALAWWLARGDDKSLGRSALRLDSAARAAVGFDQQALLANAGEARAYLALLRGDSGSALRQLQLLPDSVCIAIVRSCKRRVLIEARLLAAARRDREAFDLLRRYFHFDTEPLAVLATLERARVAEPLGERQSAIEAYQFVLDTWRNSDPSLRAYVDEARKGLRRLSGETADER